MTLVNELIPCLQVLVVKLFSHLTVSHTNIDLSHSLIIVNQLTLHAMINGNLFNLLQARNSFFISMHDGKNSSLLLHGLDNALLTVGRDILCLTEHLVIVIEGLLILAILKGLGGLAEHTRALPHLHAVAQLQTLKTGQIWRNEFSFAFIVYHVQHVIDAGHSHIPLSRLDGDVKG